MCYSKLCCVFAGNSDGINIRISEYQHQHQKICHIRRSVHVLTLKSNEQNLRSTYSDSDLDLNNVISTQKQSE